MVPRRLFQKWRRSASPQIHHKEVAWMKGFGTDTSSGIGQNSGAFAASSLQESIYISQPSNKVSLNLQIHLMAFPPPPPQSHVRRTNIDPSSVASHDGDIAVPSLSCWLHAALYQKTPPQHKEHQDCEELLEEEEHQDLAALQQSSLGKPGHRLAGTSQE